MNDRTTGFILRETDYKDNSVILTVLTREYGKISFVAQGVRKMTSHNRGSILPYTKGEFLFDYKEGKTIFRMRTAHTVSFYRHLHEDLDASLAIAVLAECADAFLLEGADMSFSQACYDLFDQACTLFEEGHRADIVLAAALASLMKLQGIGPDVDECVQCGRTDVVSISVREGGFLCAVCAGKTASLVREPYELRRFRLINKAELSHVPVLEEHIDTAYPDLTLLVEMIRLHAGLSLKSYALFQRMFSGA